MVVQTEHVQYPAVLGRSGEITESEHLVERRQQELEPTLLPFTVVTPVSYTHLRAHETGRNLVCRLLLEKK